MLRRPPTAISITPDDIADFETRRHHRMAAAAATRQKQEQLDREERALRTRLEEMNRARVVHRTGHDRNGHDRDPFMDSMMGEDEDMTADVEVDDSLLGMGMREQGVLAGYRSGGKASALFATPTAGAQDDSANPGIRAGNIRDKRRAAAAAAAAAASTTGRSGDGGAGGDFEEFGMVGGWVGSAEGGGFDGVEGGWIEDVEGREFGAVGGFTGVTPVAQMPPPLRFGKDRAAARYERIVGQSAPPAGPAFEPPGAPARGGSRR